MPKLILRAPLTFEAGFVRIRSELDVPTSFSDEVLTEAEQATPSVGDDQRLDSRQLPLVAIDPPGSTDLDQAFAAERRGDGYRVFYAIADVGGFVRPGGTIDTEARRRGATLYSPDDRAPLHPPLLSEDRASLLAGAARPALLWTIDLDAEGRPLNWRLERAVVEIRAAISYRSAQDLIDRGSEDGSATIHGNDLGLLAEIGRLRQAREAERGAVSINLPAQEVVSRNGSYALEFDRSLPVEGWNAQISLLTGIVAARTMVDAGVGVLRTLPPARRDALDQLRLTATALGLDWHPEVPYADFVRHLDPNVAAANTFMLQSTRTLRGAGYVGFASGAPDHAEHAAIASLYAHVTAPLRRLVDRFGNEILLSIFAGERPPAWAVEALDELPSLMGRAKQRESALERAMLDFAEAIVLEHSVGELFEGLVVDVDEARSRSRVQIAEPAVVADVEGAVGTLGQHLELRLAAVDLNARSVHFEVAD